MQFFVGLMVLASLAVTAVILWVFVGSELLRGTYPLYVKFSDAPGVTRGAPVRKSGIRIGRVGDIQFADDDRSVLVTVYIDKKHDVYPNEVCQATGALLMAEASLDLVRSSKAAVSQEPLAPGSTIDGVAAQDPIRVIANLQIELTKTMDSVTGAGNEMQAVLVRVDRLLQANEQQITKVIGQADETLKVLQQALANSNDILGDAKVRQQIKDSVAQMPEVLKDTRQTVELMGETIGSLQKNLNNLEGLTKPLGQRGESLVVRIDQSTVKLDRLMDEMLRFSRDLNDPQGSIGQIVHDPELYQHLNRTARNIDQLTRDLKPIVDDARIFSDKIARHPEQLGIRGAIQRSPGLK
jgi:phospholipid/cholesterol/gamma-HCH transport system substrate-binding protein